LALLLRPPLGAVHVGLDPTRLLGIRHANPRWVVRRDHQDAAPGGSLVVGGDAALGPLKLAVVQRRGSLCGAQGVTLLIDLIL
jgi:hypothetical protein